MFRYRILTAILLLWAICAAGQEKIHVQTDRGTYLPGERIWLRAHLVDGSDGRPSRIRTMPVPSSCLSACSQ